MTDAGFSQDFNPESQKDWERLAFLRRKIAETQDIIRQSLELIASSHEAVEFLNRLQQQLF